MLWVPFFLMSVLPLALVPLLSRDWALVLVHLVLIHAAACCGDMLATWRIGRQVPAGSLVYNKGWRTYYR
jgi:hypothetical protein